MHSTLRNCLLLLFLAPHLATQAPTAANLSIGIVPIRLHQDGSQWAATDSYKASFHGGATFVPYLGAVYPENRPLSWRTASVRVGRRDLLAPDERPDRWHSATRYEYRCGAVTEAYDVLEAGLEQTFTFSKRPAGEGDLVITGRITTGLTCAPVSGESQALTFHDAEGRAIARYGEALVIDADGREGPVRTTYRNGVAELRVAASWLETARFPVVVDPLLTRASVSLNSQDEYGSVDVAFHEDTDKVLVVHTAAASSIDRDVFAKMFDFDWTGRQTVFTELTTADTPHVRVAATTYLTPTFGIVFQRRTSSVILGTRLWRSNVSFVAIRGDTGALMSNWVVPMPSGTHAWRPDVAGILGTGLSGVPPMIFVVAVQRESSGNWFQNTGASRIEVLHTDHLGVVSRQTPPVITFGADDQERPSIASRGEERSGALPDAEWMVVWQERQSTDPGDDWNVVGRRLRLMTSLTVFGSSWTSTGGAIRSHHRMGPRVAGTYGRYLVTFTRSPLSAVPTTPASIDGHSLCTERVDWTSQGVTNHPERVIRGPFANARLVAGDCAIDSSHRSHWAVTSHSARPNGDGSVSIQRVGYRGLPTETAVLHSASGSEQGLAGGVSFDRIRERWYTAWAVNGGFAHRVYGNVFVYTTPNPPALTGTSCSAAMFGWTGNQQIGSESEFAELTGAQGGRLALLVAALSTTDIDLTSFQMPFCRALVSTSGPGYLGILGTVTSSTGTAVFRFQLPEFLTPFNLHLQWFHGQDNANPVGLVSTRRLTVQLAK